MPHLDSFNIVDISIILVLVLSIILGLVRGLVSEIVSLVSLVAAFIIATLYSHPLATYFTDLHATNHTTQAASDLSIGVSYAVLFFCTLLVGFMVRIILNKLVRASMLGVGNRILGGVFGCVRGYALNIVIIFVVQLSPWADNPTWQNSQLVPLFKPSLKWLENMVSPTLDSLKSHL